MRRKTSYALLIAITGTLAVGAAATAFEASGPAITVDPLLATATTILGQTLAYPKSAAPEVTSVIITMPPGAETGWHRHDVPLYGHMLDGELTVTYRGEGVRVYKAGDTFMEAFQTPHNGRNTGTGPVRILAVFIGADGVANTVKLE